MTFIPLEWATDTNYPAGADAWSGTPTRVVPSAGTKTHGFTPESPASAQELNWLVGSAADAVNFLAVAAQLYEYSSASVASVIPNVGPGVTANTSTLVSSSIPTLVGDVVEITISGAIAVNGSTNPAYIEMYVQTRQNGGAWTDVANSLRYKQSPPLASFGVTRDCYHITVPVIVSVPGSFDVRIRYSTTGDVGTLFDLSDTTSSVKVFRKLI